jgi:hypothetical protein
LLAQVELLEVGDDGLGTHGGWFLPLGSFCG